MKRVAVILSCAALASAQQLNPVYTDDSPAARETLARTAQIAAAGNEAEAVRELQKLLDEQPDRLVEAGADPDLFISVRTRVNRAILETPKLLEQYRASETVRAQQLLAGGDFLTVERTRLLTAPGFEGALRVAQTQLESAQFDAALLTLTQLERHPDRKTPQGGHDAAVMARTIARYIDRPDAHSLAERWATEASLGPADQTAFPAPACLKTPQAGFMKPSVPFDIAGIPPRPLWSTILEPQTMPLEPEEALQRLEQNEEQATNLWVFPTIVGDTIYVNDGVFIAARDRFTLQTRWSVRPVSEDGAADPWAPRRAGVASRLVEDTCTITAQCHTLVATMGIAQNGDREGESGTFAIDAATGRVVWSALLHRLDAQLEGAAVRGPALIDGDTVIVAARKTSQGRRIISAYLVGLSLDNGALKWVRPIASAGSIPWGRGEQRVYAAPLLDRGIVYCTDHLGVIGAVESSTGRPVWVRRAPTPAIGGGGISDAASPWHWSVPIADADGVILLSPDRSELLRLDRTSGQVMARRAGSELGNPAYLLRVGDHLACVAADKIVVIPAGDISGAAHQTPLFRNPPIRGRVVVSGDRLLAPRPDGISVIDPADPRKDPGVIRLERLGNILPLESQLLVIDSTNLHSYLTWNVAQKLLQDRMAGAPDDPEPAVTYADLAYRSGHPEQIADAADKALTAIEKAPTAEPMRLARQRLFKVLRGMVDASQEKWTAEPSPRKEPIPKPARREQNVRTARVEPTELPVLELKWLAPVIDRLGRAANSPDERVTHLMALGRLRDAQGQGALAAESYQAVLSDQLLAAASWQGTSAAVRAEIEATRRIRQLVLDKGPSAYGAFEAQAALELQRLGPQARAQDLERFARQFPAAAASATAWTRAADLQESASRKHAAIADLREALIVAETVKTSGAPMDAGQLGEIAGRLVARLQKQDQLFAAAQLLSRVRAQHPELALSDHGAPIDGAALSRDLTSRLAGLDRLPRIGPDVRADAQGLPGWQIMTPRTRKAGGRAAEHVMLIAAGDSKVALWGVGAAPDAASGPPGSAAHLQMLWSREYKGGLPPHLLRLDPDSVYLFWERTEAGDGPVVERIGAVGGETRWRTEPFRSLFPADPELDRRLLTTQTFDTPVEGAVRVRDFVFAADESVLALVERSGRAAAFDMESGRLLWHTTAPVSQVFDVDAGAGVVAIGGGAPPPGDRNAIAGLNPAIAVYDARSGNPMTAPENLPGRVRWLRIAGPNAGAAIVAGLDTEVASFDLARGRQSWSIPGGAAFESIDAWTFADRLFLLDRQRNLWLVSLAGGQISRQPLETYEHLQGSSRIDGAAVGKDLTAFTTDRGVCIFDANGRLAGIDAVTGNEADEGSLTMPAQSESYFVAIQTNQHQNDAGQNVYDLHVMDAKTGILKASRQLALELPPRFVTILDGRILVTAGGNTVVYSAPEADR